MQTLRIKTRGLHSRRGSALVMVLLAAAAMATLSFSILAISMAGMRAQRGSKEQMSARYVCEAGLSEAVFQLSKGNTGDVGSAAQPASYDGGSFWVQATDLGDQKVQLVATGEVDRAGERIELTLEEVSDNLFLWGAFGDEDMQMDSNARVDSYDSTLGSYDSQKVNGSGSNAYANAKGNVGSNNDVALKQNAKVWGDALPGPSGATTAPLGAVSGATTPMLTPVAMPPIEVPVIASAGPLTVPGNAPLVLPSGSYHYDAFTVDTGGLVTVQGPAKIVFEDFRLKSNARFIADASAGPVEVYVMGDFILDSNTLMAPSDYLPVNLDIKLLTDNVYDPSLQVQLDVLTLNSNAQLYGTVYAPNTVVDIDSNFELFGSLVARQVTLDSNARVHYDESLANAANAANASYKIICWRTLPYQP